MDCVTRPSCAGWAVRLKTPGPAWTPRTRGGYRRGLPTRFDSTAAPISRPTAVPAPTTMNQSGSCVKTNRRVARPEPTTVPASIPSAAGRYERRALGSCGSDRSEVSGGAFRAGLMRSPSRLRAAYEAPSSGAGTRAWAGFGQRDRGGCVDASLGMRPQSSREVRHGTSVIPPHRAPGTGGSIRNHDATTRYARGTRFDPSSTHVSLANRTGDSMTDFRPQ